MVGVRMCFYLPNKLDLAAVARLQLLQLACGVPVGHVRQMVTILVQDLTRPPHPAGKHFLLCMRVSQEAAHRGAVFAFSFCFAVAAERGQVHRPVAQAFQIAQPSPQAAAGAPEPTQRPNSSDPRATAAYCARGPPPRARAWSVRWCGSADGPPVRYMFPLSSCPQHFCLTSLRIMTSAPSPYIFRNLTSA
jgi:hypothetical protein